MIMIRLLLVLLLCSCCYCFKSISKPILTQTKILMEEINNYDNINKDKSSTEDIVDEFCQATNSFFKSLTIPSFRRYAELVDMKRDQSFFDKVISPPQNPGLPRPVTFTIVASVPSLLGWYGWYKFCVEEELFQDELKRKGKVSGCGGYGTLLPFVFLFLIGGMTSIVPFVNQVSGPCFEAGGLWILLGQVHLYRRVNELCVEVGEEEPLHPWWALLPPPLDVVVGLRQVHFLAKYWANIRKEDFEKDVFADNLFPFISSPRFTLQEFALEPKRWFWFTKDAKNIEI